MGRNHVNHGADNQDFPDGSFFRGWTRCFFDEPIFAIFDQIGYYHCTTDSKSQTGHDGDCQDKKPGEPIGIKILNPKHDEEKPGRNSHGFHHGIFHFEICSSVVDGAIIEFFADKSKRRLGAKDGLRGFGSLVATFFATTTFDSAGDKKSGGERHYSPSDQNVGDRECHFRDSVNSYTTELFSFVMCLV